MKNAYPILMYRWAVLLLATFFVIYTILFRDWSAVGGPLRYLTIWGLCLSWVVAYLVLRISRGISDAQWDALVSATVVINTMIVFLYWRLYFADPASVTRDGALDVWWREYYLHALGPALMIIDALFINRVFLRIKAGIALLVSIIVTYIAWSEIVVGPFNTEPVGKVTSGLPYPFLNDLEFAGRAIFYGTNIGVGLVFFAVFACLAWGIRKLR